MELALAASIPAEAPGRYRKSRKMYNLRLQPSLPRKEKRPAKISIVDSARIESLVAGAVGGSAAEVEADVDAMPGLSACKVFAGMPLPLGATATEAGMNFAVHSSGALAATLCLFTLPDLKKNRVTKEILLDPLINKTGSIWHAFLEGNFKDIVYGYKFDGKFSPEEGHYFNNSRVVLDPYSKAVISRGKYGILEPDGNCWPQMAGMLPLFGSEFDWEGDLPLRYPQKDLIIYEMHVRGYTKHESSKVDFPGTYIGVVQKLDHLKELGVNCIELMPCQEFNELEYFRSSLCSENRMNFWGYSTINFFSPMLRYSSTSMSDRGLDAIDEFKMLVREAHKRGIEVIIDIVLNHTAEGNENGPIFSFRGIDNRAYYMIAPKGEFYNYSGCGNTFNCSHPIVRQFIKDCMSFFAVGWHVVGCKMLRHLFGRNVSACYMKCSSKISLKESRHQCVFSLLLLLH